MIGKGKSEPKDGYTRREIEHRRQIALQQSEKAVLHNPECYQELKRLLRYVVCCALDIDAYHETAMRLAALIDRMGSDTIFYSYFYENIHPGKFGRAQHFRYICKDLLLQVEELGRWRCGRRKLKLIR